MTTRSCRSASLTGVLETPSLRLLLVLSSKAVCLLTLFGEVVGQPWWCWS